VVFILDTGSTDGSERAFSAKGATVRSAGVEPWRFDVARNMALALVPRDYDVCIALDIDERAKSFFNYGWAWDSLPWGILSVAAWHLGRAGEAVAAGREAVRLAPNDPELRDNLKLMSVEAEHAAKS
jgi:hypothetical protein